MALEIETFEKKPVQIQAVQYINTQTRANQIIDWIQKNGHEAHALYEVAVVDATTEGGTLIPFEHSKLVGIEIVTLEGKMLATENDWIIKGIKGEFYPCKPDVFEDSYVKVGN